MAASRDTGGQKYWLDGSSEGTLIQDSRPVGGQKYWLDGSSSGTIAPEEMVSIRRRVIIAAA